MEGGDQSSVAVGNGHGGSRWNPTKEQINMLEGLYRQGLRTPTAEQIQQITTRLRAFGHIEGKNVFYWFQNHKARQRQKQKQESFAAAAYFNRFQQFQHYSSSPVFFPAHQNVVRSPCYIPTAPAKNEHLGFYQQQFPKVPLPSAGGGFKRTKLIPERYNKSMHDNPRRSKSFEDDDEEEESTTSMNNNHQETLDLFPIHPTGILESRSGNDHQNENTPSSSDCSIFGNDGGAANKGTDDHDHDDDHTFIDFFCGSKF